MYHFKDDWILYGKGKNTDLDSPDPPPTAFSKPKVEKIFLNNQLIITWSFTQPQGTN